MKRTILVLAAVASLLIAAPVDASGGTVGRATWSRALDGHTALAGPELRHLPGPWKGAFVAVCRGDATWEACVKVRLVGACTSCFLVMSNESFNDLAPLSRGRFRAHVYFITTP